VSTSRTRGVCESPAAGEPPSSPTGEKTRHAICHVNESVEPFVFTVISPRHLVLCVPTTAALFLVSCGDNASSGTTIAPTTLAPSTTTVTTTITPATVAPTTSPSNDVVVKGYQFPPITAAAGSTLKLIDADDEPHTVTADDGSFDVGPFNPSMPATLTVPTTPGSYAFHCKVHPTMHGTLVVQ